MNEGSLDRLRQRDLVDQRVSGARVHMIGAGGIGSATALLLAKIGFGSGDGGSMTIWDPDTVEGVNVPVQWFERRAVGRPKVEALARQLRAFSDLRVVTRAREWEPPVDRQGIYVCGVDSMMARRSLWHEFHRDFPLLYVDARMGAQAGIVYCVTTNRIRSYARTLHSERDIVRDPCTAKSICHTPFLIASTIASLLLEFSRGDLPPFETSMDSRSRMILHMAEEPASEQAGAG